MSAKVCRWGVLSAAEIARKNWHSIAASGNSQLVAVASRDVVKAKTFIDACQASVPVSHTVDALGSYDQLLQRKDIDAVYIPLPTAIRTEWVLKAAQAGKHVLVEKPCGVDVGEVRAMIQACSERNLQFMDGVMFMHSSRLPAMRAVLDDPSAIGTIRHIASQFCFCAPEEWFTTNIRVSSELEPAGCVGDLGWYTIRMTLWTMKMQMPTEVRGRILHGIQRPGSRVSVPVEFQGEMHFEGGTSASFFNSFRVHNTQYVAV
ncbi:MAG: Gfo/Idh/MocA family protein, partial [Planctomyces sp.]